MPESINCRPITGLVEVPLAEAEPVNPPCEVCGNHYPQAFSIVMEGVTHVFDCFECAIHQLAPVCGHCGCRIIGHGLQAGKLFFCCSHCARESGERAVAGEMLPPRTHHAPPPTRHL